MKKSLYLHKLINLLVKNLHFYSFNLSKNLLALNLKL